MTYQLDEVRKSHLLRRGRLAEYLTLTWNVAGVLVLGFAAYLAKSVALAGFGVDSLIEIGASTVVLWELAGASQSRQRTASRLIGASFIALAVYLCVQSTFVLVIGFHSHHSNPGILWTALTALVMFALAAAKFRTGEALNNPVLKAEGHVTFIDGVLAASVLLGLVLNAIVGWWWADPAASYVILFYAVREAAQILGHPFNAGTEVSGP